MLAQFHWSLHISSIPYFGLSTQTFLVSSTRGLCQKKFKNHILRSFTYFQLSSCSAFSVDAYTVSASPGLLPTFTTGIFCTTGFHIIKSKRCNRSNHSKSFFVCVVRERERRQVMLPFPKLFQMHQPSPTPLFLFRFLGCIPRNLPQDPSQTSELIYIYI